MTDETTTVPATFELTWLRSHASDIFEMPQDVNDAKDEDLQFPPVDLRDELDKVRAALDDAVTVGASAERARDKAIAERDQLRRWKAEALPIMAGLQDLGKALGLPLGSQITGDLAAEAALDLRAERDRARATAVQLEQELAKVRGELATARARWLQADDAAAGTVVQVS